MNIIEAGAAIRNRKISCLELTEQCLAAIARKNQLLNAFITITEESARTKARQLDSDLANGRDRGPLHGIPLAHKDLIDTAGIRTTSGSALFANRIPQCDAPVVGLLADAGAVLIGKTGLHELAYGVTSENPHFGNIRNPRNPEHLPGGSSGGAGAALASGMCLLATGTDTGGSIRIPASFCGIAGLKPTYGLVNRQGIRPLGLTLDHVGPMASDVRDLRPALDAMAPDRKRVAGPETFRGLRIGVPRRFYFDRIEPSVLTAVEQRLKAATAAGADVIEVKTPDVEGLNAAARVILLAEASALYAGQLHRSTGQRSAFGHDVLSLLDQGASVPAVSYVNAQRMRNVFAEQFRALFRKVDCLITPTTPTAAPRIGQREVIVGDSAEDTRLASTRLVRGLNALGLPALSIPCGESADHLPLGLQIIGRPYEDDVVLMAGEALSILAA